MSFTIEYSPLAKKDRKILRTTSLSRKAEQALVDLQLDPFPPFPPPEKKEHLKGWPNVYSTRLSKGARIVYQISGNEIYILGMRGHYDHLQKRFRNRLKK